ncbi:MAG: kelch repeat-containing protein [uncultured bacterium]|nr:MAG: kelch repeat-containing protein [uncultured bacterium]OGH14686.1 MAG: hypothetical protein A2687_01270 [Candidatus Levybacteria bacterium RIFCSPHIGHO2_01_FULL_38_26]
MKKIKTSLFLLLLLILLASIVYLFYVRGVAIVPYLQGPQDVQHSGITFEYEWLVKKDMPTPRTEVSAAAVGGKIYVIGGFDGFGRTSNAVEIYDPSSDMWSQGPSLPEGRHHAAAVSVENKLFVIGGFAGGFDPKSDLFLLDLDIPSNPSWQKKSDLPTPRGAMAAAYIDGKIYAVAGVSRNRLSDKLEVYDLETGKWEEMKNAPTKREHLAAAALDGLLYVGAGREQSLSKNLNVLEVYDPTTDSWRKESPLPTARGGVAGASFNGLFVVAGGEQPISTFREVEAYDPVGKKWVALPSLPTPRHGLSAVVIDNSLYVIGGGKNPGLSVSGSNEVLRVK